MAAVGAWRFRTDRDREDNLLKLPVAASLAVLAAAFPMGGQRRATNPGIREAADSKPSLTAAPNPVVFGQQHSAALRTPDRRQQRGGRPVILQGAPHPFTTFDNSVATATTDSAGRYSFTRRPRRRTRYRVSIDGVLSPLVTVLVRQRVSLYLSDSAPGAASWSASPGARAPSTTVARSRFRSARARAAGARCAVPGCVMRGAARSTRAGCGSSATGPSGPWSPPTPITPAASAGCGQPTRTARAGTAGDPGCPAARGAGGRGRAGSRTDISPRQVLTLRWAFMRAA